METFRADGKQVCHNCTGLAPSRFAPEQEAEIIADVSVIGRAETALKWGISISTLDRRIRGRKIVRVYGHCSCGEPLTKARQQRCAPCAQAKYRADNRLYYERKIAERGVPVRAYKRKAAA
jgi:hypothetical protein